jgi:hypothetical protein
MRSRVRRVSDGNRTVAVEQIGAEEGKYQLEQLGWHALWAGDDCGDFDDTADESCLSLDPATRASATKEPNYCQ